MSDLVLSGDGLGPLQFGAPAQTVLEALHSLLGNPTSINDFEFHPYEVSDGVQIYAEDRDLSITRLWDRPAGREACWRILFLWDCENWADTREMDLVR